MDEKNLIHLIQKEFGFAGIGGAGFSGAGFGGAGFSGAEFSGAGFGGAGIDWYELGSYKFISLHNIQAGFS